MKKETRDKIADLLDRKPPWQVDLETENKKLREALEKIEKYDGNSCSHCQNIAKQAVKGDE